MTDTSNYPLSLQTVLDDFSWIIERRERYDMLLYYADQFEPVPERVAAPPYPESHRVPACESEAYVWLDERPDGTLDPHFAVENPQGLSAMALGAILEQTLTGQPAEVIVRVSPEIVFDLFGDDLSMGKGQGLTSMVAMLQAFARQRISD